MLVITRKRFESVEIGEGVVVVLLGIENGVARLGIKAPKNVSIRRTELSKREVQAPAPPAASGEPAPTPVPRRPVLRLRETPAAPKSIRAA